jgi:succinoglycan biosynthesis protein ExoM
VKLLSNPQSSEAADELSAKIARWGMPRPSDIRVAVCIVTFRRQELLRELLGGIAQLTFLKVQTPRIQVVVVDNDELASAEEACRTASVPWPIKYVVEPKRGITHVRNRAIAEAGTVDFVAFIDDDEAPSAHWLDELLWTQAEFGADVISGPVWPRYAADVADWVRNGGFFDGRVSASGTTRRACATNNVLVGTHVFRTVPRFDDAFALSGAEDTHFFLRVWQAGYKIVWSQEAVVFEAVSAERGTVAWILRREYQTGNGWIFSEAGVDNRLHIWVARFSKAWGHIVIGSANTIFRSVLLDRAAVVRSLQRVTLGAGMLAALAGHRFLAYKNSGSKQLRTLTRVAGRVERPSEP